MPREVIEHGAWLSDAFLLVALAEDRLGARLVRLLVKLELSGLAAQRARAADRPARQRLREGRDVLLRLAAVHSERVQLENLAREILIDAELA
jgi:hypothetical protein